MDTSPTIEASGQFGAFLVPNPTCAREHAASPSAAAGEIEMPCGSATTAFCSVGVARPPAWSFCGIFRSTVSPDGASACDESGVTSIDGLNDRPSHPVRDSGVEEIVGTNWPGCCHESAVMVAEPGTPQNVGLVMNGLRGAPLGTEQFGSVLPAHRPRWLSWLGSAGTPQKVSEDPRTGISAETLEIVVVRP